MAETTQMLSFHELFFNVDNGYLEGLVRGFRSGVLTQSDYLNLSQCETLEGNDVEVITENLSGKFIAIFLLGCLEYVKLKCKNNQKCQKVNNTIS